jgi:hypothetical protein
VLALVMSASGCSQAVPRLVPDVELWAAWPPPALSHGDNVRFLLFSPRVVALGDSVPTRVEVENVAGRGWLELSFAGRSPHIDLVVYDRAMHEIYRYSRGLEPLMNQDLRSLDVGERLVFPFVWDQRTGSAVRPGSPIAPGDYYLSAFVRFGNGEVELPTRTLTVQ